MDPTRDEIAAIAGEGNVVASILDWAGVPNNVKEWLYLHTGLSDVSKLRVFARFEQDDLGAVMAENISSAGKKALGLAVRGAKVIMVSSPRSRRNGLGEHKNKTRRRRLQSKPRGPRRPQHIPPTSKVQPVSSPTIMGTRRAST